MVMRSSGQKLTQVQLQEMVLEADADGKLSRYLEDRM